MRLAVLALACASILGAQVVPVSSGPEVNVSDTTSNITSYTCPTGDNVAISIWESSASTLTVTDSASNSYASLGAQYSNGAGFFGQWFMARMATGLSSGTVTIHGAAGGFSGAVPHCLSGVQASSPQDTTATANNYSGLFVSSMSSGTFSTSNFTHEFVLASVVLSSPGGSAPTATGGYTLGAYGTNGQAIASMYQNFTGPQSAIAVTATASANTDYAFMVVALYSTTSIPYVPPPPTDTLDSTTVIQASPVLPGINVAQPAYYGPGQFLKNLFGLVNPGMEGWITSVIIRCGSGSTTTCTGANPNPYTSDPANFLAGGSFYFPVAGANWVGPNTSCAGTISSTDGASGYTFPACGASVVADDYLAILKTGASATATTSGNYYGNYIVSLANSATVSIAAGDLPPSVDGTHAMKIDTSAGPTASASLEVDTDTGSAGPDIYVNGGNWTLSLWAKVASCTGTCTFSMSIQRAGGGFNHSSGTITPTPNSTPNAGWQQYTVAFAGTENPAPAGSIQWRLATSGQGVFWLKGLDFEQTSGTDTLNTSIFRDVWVHKWQAYHPGTLRLDWGSGIRDTLDDWITPTFGRQMSGTLTQFPPTATGMGLDDFLRLCQNVGADPYFSIPNQYTAADMANLMDYLGGSSGTTYGAKRAALGQVAPWTSVFGTIHIEAGNEDWNTSFPYEDMPAVGANTYVPFGANCKRIFGAAKASASWTAGKFDFILGCLQGNTSNCLGAHNWDPNHDSVNQSGYNPVNSGPLTTVNATTEWSSKYAEAWGYVHDAVGGNGSLLNAALLGSSRPVPWSVYEYRENDLGYGGSTATLAQLSVDVAALGSGLAEFVGAMERMEAYNPVQNMWDAGDFSTGSALGQIPLFGASVGVGGINNRDRPGLTMQSLVNSSIAGYKLVSSSISGGPTFNSGAVNGHAALNGVQDVSSFYFANGANRILIFTNGDPSASHTITIAGESLVGAVTQTVVNSTSITDTNETTVNVAPVVSTISATSNYSIPAHSMVLLAWNTGAPSVSMGGAATVGGATVIH